MNILFYDFQMLAVVQCHGYFCYRTLKKTGHEIQDGGRLRKRHETQILR